MIVPLYKGKGPKTNPSSYRPISLLPTTSKVFENIVHSRLNSFLNTHNIFCENQHGFRQDRSTESAITKFLNEVKLALDNKKRVGAVFVDFKKAFDLVDRKVLLKKLKSFNLSDNLLQFFKSYLENRQIAVKLGDNISGFHTLDKGVPRPTP